MPDNLRIAVDELRKRMENGEDFTIIDTRNPQAWSQSDDCRTKFVSPWTRSTRTFPKFQRTNRLLPTVPDRTKVPAPVWRAKTSAPWIPECLGASGRARCLAECGSAVRIKDKSSLASRDNSAHVNTTERCKIKGEA